MNSGPSLHLSVVIPAYNEELRLPHTLGSVAGYLCLQAYGSEIIVVDDGSTDGTAKVVRAVATGKIPVRLCAHPDGANRGKGASVKLGMQHASGDYRLFMDADNSTTIDQVERCWPAFERGCDVVIGSRKVAGAEIVVRQAWYKELAGRFGNLFIQLLVAPGISDTQAGFKAFTRRSAEEIFPRLSIDRWGFDFEIVAVSFALRHRVCEVPIRWVNSPDSKVRLGSYFQVLSEVWHVHRNCKAGRYR